MDNPLIGGLCAAVGASGVFLSLYRQVQRLKVPVEDEVVRIPRRYRSQDVSFAATRDGALAQRLTDLINAAYAIELGDTGLAFKRKNRMSVENMQEALQDEQLRILVARVTNDGSDGDDGGSGPHNVASASTGAAGAGKAGDDSATIKAVAFFGYLDGGRVATFGPFAVEPREQGTGLGSLFVDYMVDLARQERAECIEVDTVNWRTDVIPFYKRRGFYEAGTRPFPLPAEYVSRPSYMVVLRFDL